MSAVTEHYRQLLAPIYLWMAGGPDAALQQGADELCALGVAAGADRAALDLGAGFGMHAIAAARSGYRVTALDTCASLLATLRELAAGPAIRTIEADLCDFPRYLTDDPLLILCMGDTLTHLASGAEVERLCQRVAARLAPGGRFVATFRDYTSCAQGDARFIPVRSDTRRIHTCFLEEENGERIRVHDIVHERLGDGWSMRVSHYPKLRLPPAAVVRQLQAHGLSVTCAAGARGMVQIVARRPE